MTRPGKRVDHEFVYERLTDGAPSIGDGRLRLRLVVSGDRLTQLQRVIYVPEAFARRYGTLRSVNDNIAAAASVAAGLLYGLGGCLIGLIWLMRRHAVRWAPAARVAGVVAVLIAGAALSSIADSWFDYDTATSASTFRVARIGSALVGGVVAWLFLTVVFATAEGLGRLAFGHHPQLWRTWRAPSAISRAVWGRTLAGYAWIGFDLAFIAIFYFLVQRYLGWWSPSDALVDPNILGRPQPWLAPVAMALQAGMMEESLFRAVPLAGAALLGRRFGREKQFVIVALVLQAIVFGCAHANYPGQPAYARPIELFVPSLVWGVVYLRYGLVPGMLFHFGFDLVLMSLPLFVTDAPGIVFDRAMVIGVLAVPLVVLIVQRLRTGRLIDLPDSERNAGSGGAGPHDALAETAAVEVVDRIGEAAAAVTVAAPPPVPTPLPRTRRDRALLIGLAVVGVTGLALRSGQSYDAPGLAVGRGEAIAIAERALSERGVVLDERWHRTARSVGIVDQAGARFLWREGDQASYRRLVGNVLAPPHWEVRFARFDGDVADRDAWRVVVVDDRPAPDGTRLVEHDLPESRPGKRLAERDARAIAEAGIARWLKTAPAALRPISAEATEQPARVDWVFRYADPAVTLPAGGEARITVEVDGDEEVAIGRSVFVPDAWSREQRRRADRLIVPKWLLGLGVAAFSVFCLVALVRRLARGDGSRRAAWVAGTLVASTLTVTTLLDLSATQFGFTVAEPFDNQLLRVGLQWLGTMVAGALAGALLAAVGVRYASRTEDPAPPAAGRWYRWGPAIAIASFVAGLGGHATWLGAAGGPRVPNVGAADSFAPSLAAFVDGLDFTVAVSASLLVAVVVSTRSRRWQIAIAAGFVAVAALARATSQDAGASSIVAAAAAGLIGWWIFRNFLRDRPGVIAPMMLCLALFNGIAAFGHPAYPGARFAALATLLSTLIGYAIWRWLVKSDERPT